MLRSRSPVTLATGTDEPVSPFGYGSLGAISSRHFGGIGLGHQVEPDPIEQAQRYGENTPVPELRERLVCSKCGCRTVDMVVTGTRQDAVSPSLR